MDATGAEFIEGLYFSFIPFSGVALCVFLSGHLDVNSELPLLPAI